VKVFLGLATLGRALRQARCRSIAVGVKGCKRRCGRFRAGMPKKEIASDPAEMTLALVLNH
jgi:hypothetical protein